MLFSWNLLKRYVNIKDEPKNIANYLTLKTCEIEEIHTRKIPDEIVIWWTTKCEKHPDADSLYITEVDCGEKWTYQIVTWAVNIKKDIYVPVALPGAYIAAKDLKIKPVVMRWVESNGMICSKEELGIAEDLDIHGIWVLDEDLNTLSKSDLGKKLSDEVPFLDNFIFDIDNKTLTNRPDLTGHLGQAIDLNAIYKRFWKEKIFMNNIPQIFEIFRNNNIFDILEHSTKLDKKLFVDSASTRSYINLELKNVEIKKSSFKERLELIDLDEQPINNFVDFSNLFMLLTGQPIHFFDADKIDGNISVEDAKWWEVFVDLTWKEHKLEKWDIIIKDNEKILALAGIIWWESSQVTEKTSNILVEIANFDPIVVRKTANRLNLRTGAKIRFEKNISPLYSLYAMILLLDQLKMSGLKYELGGLNYFYTDEVKKLYSKHLEINFDELRSFSWINIPDEDIKDILQNLWFEFNWNRIRVPFWRSPADINIKEDIFEEVIRIYGYENINWKELTKVMENTPYSEKVEITRLAEEVFVEDFRFTEVETYPWINLETVDKIKKINPEELFSLQNPVSPETKYLRPNLCSNLLEVVAKNFREYDNIKVFEVGRVFKRWQKIKPEDSQKMGEKLVAWAMVYQKEVKNFKENNIFILKNALDKLLKEYWLKWLLEYKPEDEMLEPVSHPKQYAKILLNKQEIWKIATVHPYYYKEFKISEKSQITFMQIDLDKLIELKNKIKVKAIQKMNYYTLEDQIVSRDLAFVISKEENYGKVLFAVNKVKEIIDVEVFDIYDLWEEKSIALTIKIYGEKMTSDDINKVMDKAIKEAEKVWARLR